MSDDRKVAVADIRREYPDKPAPAEITKRNVRAIEATILGLKQVRKRDQIGKQEPSQPGAKGMSAHEQKGKQVEPFRRLMESGRLVEPPFDMLTLAMLCENNTELMPAVEAMCVNVESFGWKLEPRFPVDENTPVATLQKIVDEQAAAENFFAYCYPHGTFDDLREFERKDFEYTGNCYTEFIEDAEGNLVGLNHLPSWTMRIAVPDQEMTPYEERRILKRVRLIEEEIPQEVSEPGSTPEGMGSESPPEGMERIQRRVRKDVTYEIDPVIRRKRFRRYVQRRGKKLVWFKELDDPRLISSKTGHVVPREKLLEEDPNQRVIPRYTLEGDRKVIRDGIIGFPVAWAANPVRHRRLYSARSPYGLPRYIGHLFAIFGSRAADEINYTTFKNNNIPSMVVSVANGMLTDGSIERVQEFVEAAIQSDDNYSKFLLLEAEPISEGMRDPGTVKVEIQPLTDKQHSDMLFVDYTKSNNDRVRRAFRFPPIFVGVSDDFSSKTTEASRKLADEQVFTPERKRDDRYYSRDVLPRIGVIWSLFRTMSPNVTENAELVRLLVSAEKSGGITPRISRHIMSLVLNQELGDIDSELLNPDQPFSLTLAQIMKDQSATQEGSGPNSQGRAGLQAPSAPRDRSTEPSSDVQRLAGWLRDEVKTRFGGVIPPSLTIGEGSDEQEWEET